VRDGVSKLYVEEAAAAAADERLAIGSGIAGPFLVQTTSALGEKRQCDEGVVERC